jgi:hypothetical protein
MTGSHHIWCHLPDGPVVVADYQEKIVPAMRRVNKRVVVDHKEPKASDVDAILAWYGANAIMSENCRQRTCDHVVV